MDSLIKRLMERILTPDVMRNTTKEQLEDAVEMLQKEIDVNESCNIRTEENDDELRKLYDAKCRCRQRISIL